MADPISVTATIITLATFIKDLIEVGQSIQRSIEKVGENRRRIRDLTNDILRTLADLANLTRGHEETFQAPALLTSLGNLKGHMLRVLEGCHQISPKRSPGFRGVKSQIKLWWNRDDIEAEIRRLKELANDCYVQFTVFSVARTELTTGRIENTTAQIEDTSRQAANTTLRVEQTLIVNNVENQVRLRRLEGMMARVFLQTQFGQNMMNETIEIIASDNKHRSLQFQYLAVEVTHLIDSVQCLLAGNDLDFEPPDWDPMDLSPIFLRSVSTKHILHTVLSLVLDIDERPAKLHMDSIIALDLGAQLATLGFDTEAMAWQAITVQILRQLVQIPGDHCLAVIPPLAFALEELSMQYSAQSQDERALQVSRQALDLYQFSLESSPEIDNRISYVSSLITHSRNLCRAKQALATISITQEAVVMCRPVLEQMLGKTFKSGSESFAEDEYKVVRSSDTFFALAAAFSAAARPREAYEASKDGLRFLLRFSRAGLISSPNPRHVDRFLDVLCEMAGDGNLTLGLLAHSVFLFRNLARIYPEDFSWRFLWLLYAYVYLCEQVSSSGLAHGLKNFRFFVNAKHRNFVQNLVPDTSSYFTRHIDNFDKHGGVTEDVIRAFFTSRHSRARDDEIFPFIRNIFFTHFDQASTALHDAITTLATATHIDSRALKRALEDIHSLLPSVSRSNQVQLLEIAAKITTHIRPASESMSPSESHIGWSAEELPQAYWSVRLVGPSGNALTSDEAIEYLARGSSKTEEKTPSGLRYWVICRALVLWETARLPEAIQAIQRVGKTLFPMPSPATPRGEVIELLVYSAIQIRILQRTGNYTEARRMLRLKVLFDTERIFPANDSEDQVLEFCFCFLRAELASVQLHLGNTEEALTDAIEACEQTLDDEQGNDGQQEILNSGLIHAFTTLSHCLAAAGQDEEALTAAEKATSKYRTTSSRTYDLRLIIRRQELGANAYHSLSLRKAASRPHEALSHAERATCLYRELVSLAPNHLPSLAFSLQNVASLSWDVDYQDECITACEEAVSIMRVVADAETYFLPALGEALEQLAGYLLEHGENENASAATYELVEVQRRIEQLPPRIEGLFR